MQIFMKHIGWIITHKFTHKFAHYSKGNYKLIAVRTSNFAVRSSRLLTPGCRGSHQESMGTSSCQGCQEDTQRLSGFFLKFRGNALVNKNLQLGSLSPFALFARAHFSTPAQLRNPGACLLCAWLCFTMSCGSGFLCPWSGGCIFCRRPLRGSSCEPPDTKLVKPWNH